MANKVVTLLIFASLFAGCSKGRDDEQETTENRQITKENDTDQETGQNGATQNAPNKESVREQNSGKKTKQPQNSKSQPLPTKPSLNHEKLIQALNTTDRNAAKKIQEQLKAEGPTIVPVLLKHVDNKSPYIHGYVQQVLIEMKDSLEPHLPALVRIIRAKESSEQARSFASRLICALGPKAKPIASDLADLLSREETYLRRLASISLRSMGPLEEAQVGILLSGYHFDSLLKRPYLLSALRAGGQRSQQWFEFVLNAIRNSDVKTNFAEIYVSFLADFGKKAAPHLVEALHGPGRIRYRYKALEAVMKLNPTVVNLLIESLKKNLRSQHNSLTFKALEHFGPAAVPAIPTLKKFCELNPNQETLVIPVYSAMGDAGILPIIGSSKKRLDLTRAEMIVGMGKNAQLALARTIASGNANRVKNILRAFKTNHREIDPRVAPYIVNEIKRKDPATCVYAIEALEKVGPVAGSPLSDLSKLFLKDSQQKYPLTRILGNYGEKAVPTFMKGLKSKSSQIRIQSLYGLGYSKTKDSKVFSKVAKALKDKDPKVRAAVRFFLLNQEENLSKSISTLLKAFKSGSDQREIIQLFIQLKSAQACSALIACVKVKDEALRLQALEGLLKIGSESEELTKATLKLLKDKSKKVRAKACLILGAHGPKDSKVLSALTKASKDKDREVSRNARRALISMKRR